MCAFNVSCDLVKLSFLGIFFPIINSPVIFKWSFVCPYLYGQEILTSCSVSLDGAYSSVDTADRNDEETHSCFVPGTGGRDLNFIVDSILCDF